MIEPGDASGRLAKIYSRVSSHDGQVDNVLKIHSLRPHTLEGHMALYKAVLHHPKNSLPKWFLESVGVLVSHLNDCSYCKRHHAAGLKRLLGGDEARFAAVKAAIESDEFGRPGEPFNPVQIEALRYARKLTIDPGAITQSDIDAMKQAGLKEGQILEVNQVAAYFSYANRTVTGLGVTVDGEKLGLSPGDSEDVGNWEHG
jgi:uncharacterized peroxidase-related enzyme